MAHMKFILDNKYAFVGAILFFAAIWIFYRFLVPTEVFFDRSAILFAVWLLLTVGYTVCGVASMVKTEAMKNFGVVFIIFDVILIVGILSVLYFSMSLSE